MEGATAANAENEEGGGSKEARVIGPAGGEQPARFDSSADYAMASLPPENQRAIVRALSHLDDAMLDDVVDASDTRLLAFKVENGGREDGPQLMLAPEAEADMLKYEQVVEKDALAPRTLGIHPGMKPGEKAAAVAKRRAKTALFAASAAGRTMAQGRHTSLSSVGVQILSMLHGATWHHPEGSVVVGLRAERFMDGILADQVVQNMVATGGHRSNSRFPVEAQSARGPWAGTQDVSSLYCWAMSFVAGSQAQAHAVLFTGEATDDALTVEGNSEVPAIVTMGEELTRGISSLSELRTELVRVLDRDGNAVDPPRERERGEREAVSAQTRLKAAIRDEAVQAVLDTVCVDDDAGGHVLSAGGLSLTVSVDDSDKSSSGGSLYTAKPRLVWKIKKVEIVVQGGRPVCPELAMLNPGLLEELVAGRNDGSVPDILMVAARLVDRLQDLAVNSAGGVSFRVPENITALTWRHFCQQVGGHGAEMAALVGFSTTLLGTAETTDRDEATTADVRWLGRRRIGAPENMIEAKEAVASATGLNSMRFHSARTRVLLGTCSPLTVWFAENKAILTHPETVPTYERHSAAGIRAACSKICCIQTSFTDRAAAIAGVGGVTFTCGVGFPDLGQGRFGPAVTQAQVVATEVAAQDGFNNKYSKSLCVSCDLVTRQPAASALGSTRRRLDSSTSCAGECPERIPPYVWSTLVGDEIPYMSSSESPSLESSEPIPNEIDVADAVLLRHGHVSRFPGSSMRRPFFSVQSGTGAEDAANPPYLAVTQQNYRLGPIANGVLRFGSYWAMRFDTRLTVTHPGLVLHSRTMGSVPFKSHFKNHPIDTLVDLPLRRSTHGAYCLTNVCTPPLIRARVAAAQPVPMSAASEALSSIFR